MTGYLCEGGRYCEHGFDSTHWVEGVSLMPGPGLTINLGLTNSILYAGCEIEEVAGRLNLKTPIADAVNIIGRNIERIITEAKLSFGNDPVTLTGPMAVWSYLIVFHAVVHRFSRVYYDDGRSGSVLIAAHG